GRLGYRWLNRQDRVEYPMVRRGDTLATAEWEAATAEAASLLAGKRAFVLVSPNLPNEALYLLSRLARKTGGGGAFRVRQGPEAPLAGVPDLSVRADRAANGRGAELLGFTRHDAPLSRMQAGDVLIVADEELAGMDAPDVARAGAIIVIGTTLPAWARHAAAVVLPIANMVEEEGTLTNLRGRVQRFRQAKSSPGFSRPSWLAIADLLTAAGERADYMLASEVFDALAASHPEFAGMSYDTLGLKGALVHGATAGATA
ncbi:MAG TPA: molybdopterin-dependent oxidoreductase, partial [Gemmatimonadaceae bacterium]